MRRRHSTLCLGEFDDVARCLDDLPSFGFAEFTGEEQALDGIIRDHR